MSIQIQVQIRYRYIYSCRYRNNRQPVCKYRYRHRFLERLSTSAGLGMRGGATSWHCRHPADSTLIKTSEAWLPTPLATRYASPLDIPPP